MSFSYSRTITIANVALHQSKAVYGQRRKLKEADKIDHPGYTCNGLLFNDLATTSNKDGSINNGHLPGESAAYEPGQPCQHIQPSGYKTKNETQGLPSQQQGMKYQPIAIEITQNGGHYYRQVWRTESHAIYEQRSRAGTFLGYEAITIKRQEAGEMFGRKLEAKELYPVSEDWGTLGKTVNTLEEAHRAITEMANAQGLLSKRAH
jgi:hypothetical protein